MRIFACYYLETFHLSFTLLTFFSPSFLSVVSVYFVLSLQPVADRTVSAVSCCLWSVALLAKGCLPLLLFTYRWVLPLCFCICYHSRWLSYFVPLIHCSLTGLFLIHGVCIFHGYMVYYLHLFACVSLSSPLSLICWCVHPHAADMDKEQKRRGRGKCEQEAKIGYDRRKERQTVNETEKERRHILDQ